MTIWALTSRADGTRAIRNLSTGKKLTFTPEDGPILADMLDDAYPQCESCEERAVCHACGECQECVGCTHLESSHGRFV